MTDHDAGSRHYQPRRSDARLHTVLTIAGAVLLIVGVIVAVAGVAHGCCAIGPTFAQWTK